MPAASLGANLLLLRRIITGKNVSKRIKNIKSFCHSASSVRRRHRRWLWNSVLTVTAASKWPVYSTSSAWRLVISASTVALKRRRKREARSWPRWRRRGLSLPGGSGDGRSWREDCSRLQKGTPIIGSKVACDSQSRTNYYLSTDNCFNCPKAHARNRTAIP